MMPDWRDAFRGSRVLVTGHTGFKGAWLCEWLLQLGAEVHGFALPVDQPAGAYALLDLESRITSRIGDLRDRDALQAAVDAAAPDIVLHLAAQAIVSEAYDDPVGTLETNVTGTANLIDVLRRRGPLPATVIVTTDKVYRPLPGRHAHVEGDAFGAIDPYSTSKACCEILVEGWREAFALRNLATARAGNVIGGADWAVNRIIPDIMRAVAAKAPMKLRYPHAVRPWQHVLEPLSGYLILAAGLAQGDESLERGWNFGPSARNDTTVIDLVRRCEAALGADLDLPDAPPRPDFREAEYLALVSDAAEAALGWRPLLDLDTTIDWTIAGYAEGGQGAAAIRQQIGAYEERLVSAIAPAKAVSP